MKYVGAHVSAGGGVQNAPLNAARVGARALALFTRNQRRWHAPPLSRDAVSDFRRNLAAAGIRPEHVLPHDSYLINLAHPDAEALTRSRAAFRDELDRCRILGLKLLNFHPGNHLGRSSEEDALARVADSLNRALEQVPGITAVIETTAGQGTSLGWRFEHLARILEQVAHRGRVGVCIDTCHIWASGYDIGSRKGYEATFSEFDAIVGLPFLRAMHLNDSRTPRNSRVDRHASLGDGTLGWRPFEWIMQDPRFDDMPLILETTDPDRWSGEIRRLYRLAAKRKTRT